MKAAYDQAAHKPVLRFTVFILFLVFSGCNCNEQFPDWHSYYKPVNKPSKNDPYKQLIVWLRPGTTEDAFSRWIYDSVIKKSNNHDLTISYVCGSCDSTLFLLEGKATEVFMQGEVASAGSGSKTRQKVTGESGPVYFTTNLPVFSPDKKDRERGDKPEAAHAIYSEPAVKVAVFDTGLDSTLMPSDFTLYNSADSSCIPGANTGWNFIDGTEDYKEDNAQLHGTTVTRFIVNEAAYYQKNSIEILPVKVFASDGTGDLFSILCGMAYAHNRKVNMINASFGFYESLHKYDGEGRQLDLFTAPVLLQAFIEHYLTRNNILLVAAAGNKDDAIEDSEYNPADSLQKRNLDSVHFYPASLSRVLPNVIAVTTVYKDMVSPTQNFSPHVIDAGVVADIVDNNGSFLFINPFDRNLEPVGGSSFATPILTGKMAAWYYLYKPLLQGYPITNTTRDSIFSLLKARALPAFVINNIALNAKLKEGRTIDKPVAAIKRLSSARKR
ncbi:MAG: S8/S53 family peptidase [Chitinophagaceae bacterium]|nr:S8/S53 family peptidase [Chitinophagaceae bacterium]